MLSLAITHARVVTPEGVLDGAVGVDGETIAYVGGDAGLPPAQRIIDGHGHYLIPGFIDAHVHLGGGRTGALDEVLAHSFALHTRAALLGGVTTMGVFIATNPAQPVTPLANAYRSVGGSRSHIDFYLHTVITSALHLDDIGPLADRYGITSFKHFYNANKPRNETEHPGHPGVESDLLFQSMERIAALGPRGLAMVHCEDQDLIWLLEDRLKAQGRKDLAAWAEARPGWVEALRMKMAYAIARVVGVPLYCVHIAAAEGVEIMAQARRDGYPFWGETCPHYLSHTSDMESEVGCWGRVNTAIKGPGDRQRLWDGLRDGSITNMGTDYGGFPREIKEGGGGKHDNIWGARSGIAGGMRHWLPVMMTLGMDEGRLPIEEIVRVCSTNNAHVFGLSPRKGVLQEGADADLVLVDPDQATTVDPAFYGETAEWSIYYGWQLKGGARLTVLRGRIAMEDGEITASPGWGQYLPRR